jgi:glycosyltransferase involved in cell wall biosynthesis
MNILISLPNLSALGGVSSYWNALLPILKTKENITIAILEIGGHGKNILGPIIDQFKFNKQLKNNYDMAFLNPSLGFKSFFRDGFFAKNLSRNKLPFIVFFHGWDIYFEQQVDKKYINFFQGSFGKAEKIIVLSSDFKNKLLEWGFKGEIIIETTNVDSSLLNGFSIEDKLSNISTSNKINILFLSRLLREKGVFETVEAFEMLVHKFDNINLIIAGDGEDYDELKKRVLGNNKIVLTGFVQGQNKIDLFEKSHIYCFPTFYGEGLPTTVLEAMAFGLPVITTNVGGLKDFFQDNKMGHLVRPKDVKQLSETLELLLSNFSKITEIGRYNYNYAHQNLLNTVVAERIYHHILTVPKN